MHDALRLSDAGKTRERYGNECKRMQAVLKRYFGRYPVGSAIPLRVNPARPTTAYVRERALPLMAVGIVVAVAFAGLLYMTVTVMFQPGMFRP